jgi:excisionase family DNA binding protein
MLDPNPTADALFCTVRDAQTVLGLSKPTVHRLISSGQLTGVKVGRRRLIVRESLDALAARLAAGEDITTTNR